MTMKQEQDDFRVINVSIVELTGEQNYLPLAAGYLAAYALADPDIRRGTEISLILEHSKVPIDRLAEALLANGMPDVLAFSCQGWAVPAVDALAERIRVLNPDVLIVYGGNHVSHEGAEFFHRRAFADVLVNGEGEIPFRELLARRVAGGSLENFATIPGVACRVGGVVVSNPDPPRIENLDTIPSPYLTGLLDSHLDRCETALLETNRGCPYHCSFCYWGQAVGQRLHRFSFERLCAEMTYLAQREVDSWFICDANFGILPQDAEVVQEIVRLRSHYGFPRTVHTNWAKNSNQRIVKLCAQLNEGGVHSTYTIAMQSTTGEALIAANRANMKINRVDEISALCRQHGVVPRGELIWGLPGETYDEFLQSYDDLALFTDALSVYPLYILPNTEYAKSKELHGIVTERAEPDTDYEYCVQHRKMTYDEFLKGLRFIISNNILKVGGVIFRLYPRIAKGVGDVPFHRVIGGFGDWVATTDHPQAARFRKYYEDPLHTHRESLLEVWLAVRTHRDGVLDMINQYAESIHADVPDSQAKAVMREAMRFDIETYPIVDSRRREEEESVDGVYRRQMAFSYDLLAFKQAQERRPQAGRFIYNVEHPAGLWRYPLPNWYFGLLGYQAKVTHTRLVYTQQ
jgi:radical SAM C-methyltransferase